MEIKINSKYCPFSILEVRAITKLHRQSNMIKIQEHINHKDSNTYKARII